MQRPQLHDSDAVRHTLQADVEPPIVMVDTRVRPARRYRRCCGWNGTWRGESRRRSLAGSVRTGDFENVLRVACAPSWALRRPHNGEGLNRRAGVVKSLQCRMRGDRTTRWCRRRQIRERTPDSHRAWEGSVRDVSCLAEQDEAGSWISLSETGLQIDVVEFGSRREPFDEAALPIGVPDLTPSTQIRDRALKRCVGSSNRVGVWPQGSTPKVIGRLRQKRRYAVGLVARASGSGVLLGYFFGHQHLRRPMLRRGVTATRERHPCSAVRSSWPATGDVAAARPTRWSGSISLADADLRSIRGTVRACSR